MSSLGPRGMTKLREELEMTKSMVVTGQTPYWEGKVTICYLEVLAMIGSMAVAEVTG